MKVLKAALFAVLASALVAPAADAATVKLFSNVAAGKNSNSGGGNSGNGNSGNGNSGGSTVPTTCSTSSVTTSTACQILAGNNDSAAALNLFNAGAGAFNVNSWLLADKNDDGALVSPYDLIANGIGNASGIWSVASFNNYQYAAIVVKGGAVAFVAYLLDLTKMSGTWSTADLINNGGNQPGLSHISLYVGGRQIVPPPPPPEVPVPAAGLLLLTALAGFGLVRARRATV